MYHIDVSAPLTAAANRNRVVDRWLNGIGTRQLANSIAMEQEVESHISSSVGNPRFLSEQLRCCFVGGMLTSAISSMVVFSGSLDFCVLDIWISRISSDVGRLRHGEPEGPQ